jgi:hypothetical protein
MADVAINGLLSADNGQILQDTGNDTAFSAVVSGAFVGTVTLQVLYDATEGWQNAPCFTRAFVAATNTLTAPGNRLINTATAISLRAVMHPFTSGAASVTFAGVGAISVAAAASGGGGGGPATIADGADFAQGTTTDAGIITDIAGTEIGFLRGAIKMWIAFLARLPAALVGGRLDVNVGAVSAASLPLPTGAAQDTTLATTNTEVGGLTETVPATDTASSGLNGRLQRVAQRITSLIALLPTALVNGALVMTGDTAAGATDAGNPVKIGALAVAHGTSPTAVTAGQRVNAASNRQGILFTIPGHPNIVTSAVTFTAAQTDRVLVANSAGTKIVLWAYSVKTSDANTVDVSARLGISATAVPADSATGLVDTHPAIAAGSGFAGGPGIMGIGADAEQLLFTCSVPTGGSIQCAYKWYTVPS